MDRSGFLQRLIGIAGFGFLSFDEAKALQKIYLLQSFVAGFRFHKGMQLLPYMQQHDLLELKREPENEHDAFAIALYWQQEMIGYLPADSNETIARLLDAKALPLLAAITHIEQNAKPWENVAIAVYFMQPQNKELPGYLHAIEQPEYTTVKQTRLYQPDSLPDLFEYNERIIETEGIEDEAARAYFERYYGKYAMVINGRKYVQVPDDGIYTYMYQVEAAGWVTGEKGEKFLEFVFIQGD